MDLPVRRIVRPGSLPEALAVLAGKPGARALAGGTDLVVQLRDGRRSADTLVDLGRLEFTSIAMHGNLLEIGAAATMDDVARHSSVRRMAPSLADAAAKVGAWPIQCRATLGGNLANASPAADTAPPLLIAGASVRVAGIAGERTIPLDAFFRGPGATALHPDELIVSILVPPPPSGPIVERFVKVGPRREQIIATVSFAGRAEIASDGRLHGVRVALGAVAPTPRRARGVEACVEGRKPDAELRREAAIAVQDDIAPIDDVRASAGYRRIAAAVLVDRFLRSAEEDRRE
ncbi:MAG: FAD binding domain-containing protein [Acidobacteriota bacterium]